MASTAVQHGLAPSSALHSSQNTTPVLEFRCLFTHDILKKQKKWHDGSLRFHTFNRRVMVYDDSKNFIGDLHYRQSDEFCEGLEFQLDKPVKVLVEEQLGVTKTDLAPLLGRSRQDDNTQKEVTCLMRNADSRLNTGNTQGRPKSIKELLGASQGRFGHAMLPQRSPFEQRQALSENNQHGPLPKRRKVASGKENSTVIPLSRSALVQTRRHPPADLPNVFTSGIISDPRRLPVEKEVNDLSCPGGPQASPLKPANLATIQHKGKKKQTTARKALNDPNGIDAILGISSKLPKSKESKRKIRSPESRPVEEHESGLERGLERSAPSNVHKHNRTDSLSTSDRPRSCLSFAPLNPRRKLLYRALLPQNDDNTEESGSIAGRLVNPLSVTEHRLACSPVQAKAHRRNGNTTTDLDEFFDDITSDQPQAAAVSSLSQYASLVVETASDDLADLQRGPVAPLDSGTSVPNIVSSPLFVPQSASQISELVAQTVQEDELLLSSSSTYAPPNIEEVNTVSTGHVDSDGGDSFTRSRPSAQNREDEEQSNALQLPATATWTAPQSNDMADPTLNVEHNRSINYQLHSDRSPQHVAHAAVPSQRTSPLRSGVLWESNSNSVTGFRRVRSENDADAGSDPVDLSEIESVTPASHRRSYLLHQPRLPPTKVLQRTTSDTTGITHQQAPSINKPAENTASRKLSTEHLGPAESSSEYETGPWTANEAFLLFEWWPEGKRKNKPDYGQIGSETINDSGLVSRNHQSTVLPGVESRKYGMFGSARFVSQR